MKRYRMALAGALLAVALHAPSALAQWGSLSGQFVFDGTAPARAPLSITKDVEFCGKHDLKSDALVVNPENGGVADIIVTLYNPRNLKVHPSYEETASASVRLDNENCRFEPHVVLLRTTQKLIIGNKDPVGHNTKIDTLANLAVNPIIPANGMLEVSFSKPERIPAAPVSCSIHPWMTALLVVRDHPYMAVTDKDGKFKIENLPAGEWEFHAWHESGHIDQVTLAGKATNWRRGRFTQTISAGDTSLGVIKVAPEVFKAQ